MCFVLVKSDYEYTRVSQTTKNDFVQFTNILLVFEYQTSITCISVVTVIGENALLD